MQLYNTVRAKQVNILFSLHAMKVCVTKTKENEMIKWKHENKMELVKDKRQIWKLVHIPHTTIQLCNCGKCEMVKTAYKDSTFLPRCHFCV